MRGRPGSVRSLVMAFSIVSALFDRARTGIGRRLQVAMQRGRHPG